MVIKEYFIDQLENPQVISEEYFNDLEYKKYHSGSDINIGDKFVFALRRIKAESGNKYTTNIICCNDDSYFENYIIDDEYVHNKEKIKEIENYEYSLLPIVRLKTDEIIQSCGFKIGDKVKTGYIKSPINSEADSKYIWSEVNGEISGILQGYIPNEFDTVYDIFEFKLGVNGWKRMVDVKNLIKI